VLPIDRAHTFENAPLDELLGVLLRQLKRPLAAYGLDLTDSEANRLARARAAGDDSPSYAELLAALKAVVAESEGLLADMGLTFRQSLDADMNAVGGWETTAEFLELANEKANAELRITLGSALALAFGGDRHYTADLLFLAGGDYDDESVIARRVLSFASGIDGNDEEWLDKVRIWAEM
jgi:hypothetical protein